MHPERQYLNLIGNILKNGIRESGRNGNTKTIIGAIMKFPLNDNIIPIMTTKKMAWKTCFKELFWFINGETDNKKLKEQNVNIWNGNGSREFLDSRNLRHYKKMIWVQYMVINGEILICHIEMQSTMKNIK